VRVSVGCDSLQHRDSLSKPQTPERRHPTLNMAAWSGSGVKPST
jgi:hypothetical protein